MTPPTVWPARRVAGDRILCGRIVAGMGYVCTGELATVHESTTEQFRIPPGWRLGPSIIGDDAVDHLTATARTARKMSEGRSPTTTPRDGSGPEYYIARSGWRRWNGTRLTFTATCPDCRCIGLLEADKLLAPVGRPR